MALANKYLVAPALWTTLSRPAFREIVPQDLRHYLALLHTRNADRNALRSVSNVSDVGTYVGRVRDCGGALLKGAAWLFDGNSLAASDRMMRDIDLASLPPTIFKRPCGPWRHPDIVMRAE